MHPKPEIDLAVQLLGKYEQVFVSCPMNASEDCIVASVALCRALKVLGKEAVLVGEAVVPDKFKDLVGAENFQNLPIHSEKLVLELDTTKAELGQLRYEVSEDKVTIYLQSKTGEYGAGDVTVYPYFAKESLFVFLGAETPESLGNLYSANTQLFYKLPKLGIDNSLSNERFANNNFIDASASSKSELVYKLLEKLGNLDVVAPVATILLAGLLSATDSLKNHFTTPSAFQVASSLVSAGADHGLAAASLFKTLGYPEVKLLGKVLGEMVVIESLGVGTSIIDKTDPRAGIEQYGYTLALLQDLSAHTAGLSGFLLFEFSTQGALVYMLGEVPEEVMVALRPGFTGYPEELHLMGKRCQKISLKLSKLETLKLLQQFP